MLYSFYYVASLLQNILAVKTVKFGFIIVDMGILLSPLVFACMDVATELHGEKHTKKMFTTACICNAISSVLLMFVSKVHGQSEEVNVAFATIFDSNWRFIISSATAFYLGSWINARIMARWKGDYGFRAATSTLLGQFVDNAIFNLLAFAPVFGHVWELPITSCLRIALVGTVYELVFESVTIPFTRKYVLKHKKA